MKQQTWLPLFTGFYHSIFDPSDNYIEMETELSEPEFKEYYNDLHLSGISQEYFNDNFYDYLDYTKGYIGVSEYICSALLAIDYTGIIQDVTYEKLCSPKYYNFSSDSINCEIEYDAEKLKLYLVKNKPELTLYVNEKYTSRDGFSSSYTNDVDYWLNEDNHGEHEVGSLLQFVLLNEDKDAVYTLCDESNILEGFMNNVSFDQNKMIKDFKEKQNKSLTMVTK